MSSKGPFRMRHHTDLAAVVMKWRGSSAFRPRAWNQPSAGGLQEDAAHDVCALSLLSFRGTARCWKARSAMVKLGVDYLKDREPKVVNGEW